MGERGPTPIPHARRRNKRPGSGRTVQVKRPKMPRELGKQAKAEWRRIVPELEEMGLIATVDRSVLIRYCRAWEDWFDIDEKLRETGLLVRGQKNNLVRNPLWMMRTDAEATLSDLGKQLGLTPAARLRQGVEHEQPVLEESAPPVVMDKYRKAIG